MLFNQMVERANLKIYFHIQPIKAVFNKKCGVALPLHKQTEKAVARLFCI
jgi:hypothetical protein